MVRVKPWQIALRSETSKLARISSRPFNGQGPRPRVPEPGFDKSKRRYQEMTAPILGVRFSGRLNENEALNLLDELGVEAACFASDAMFDGSGSI